jgi:collagenase-like PrtC family protease
MRLAIGPLLYYWEREAADRFYDAVAASPADIVYLGESVCSKRRTYRTVEWFALAERLRDAGKEVVLTTLALTEAESELAQAARVAGHESLLVEANDLAVVELRGGRPFVIGPHVNVYNPHTLRLLASQGARRWVAPVELGLEQLTALSAARPAGLELEVFAWGRMPLAVSARCFTARAHDRAKDDCDFICNRYPDGLMVQTREDERFLNVNGVQVQSARIHNAIGWLPRLRGIGVDVLRLSPSASRFFEVVQEFRAALDGGPVPEPADPDDYCDGYLAGAAGMERAAGAMRE